MMNPPTHRRNARERGFTLVEIAIVLVAIGLIMGGLLIPIHERSVAAEYSTVEDQFDSVRKAVIGYALRHRTAPLTIEVVRGSTDLATYDVKPGRPYLPCPDVDGDGAEDREDLPTGYPYTVTVDIAAAPNETTAQVAGRYGLCTSQFGALPWRTLGVPSSDPWGQRFTYRVDFAFSNSLVGFDQDTVADRYDTSKGLRLDSGNHVYSPREEVGTAGFSAKNYTPLLVCDAYARNDGCLLENITGTNVDQNDDLLAGAVATGDVSASPSRLRAFDEISSADSVANAVIDGVPFIVISHGSNGARGQIDSNPTVCKEAASSEFDPAEVDNGYHAPGTLECRDTVTTDSNKHPTAANAAPRSRATVDGVEVEFDDSVVWMDRQELVSRLSGAGVLPLRPYPKFGSTDL